MRGPGWPRRRAPILIAVVLASALTLVGTPGAAAQSQPEGVPPVAPAASVTSLPPVQVALDQTLVVPQPGDSAATRAGRLELASAQRAYAAANQRYDAAASAAADAQVLLQLAQQNDAVASALAAQARQDVASMAVDLYESADPVPASVEVLLSSRGNDVLDDLARQQQIASYQADTTDRAVTAQAVADQAAEQVAAAQAAAATAQAAAVAAQRTAADLVGKAQQAVAALHIKDLEAAAQAAAARARIAGTGALGGQDNAVSAAALLQAQALASGAAKPADFPPNATAVATIDRAIRALLHKASARGSAPVDETAVMGPAPSLGATAAWTGATGDGPSLALTPFDGTVSTASWPNAGVGTAVPGTAPFLTPDGVSVHPDVPRYPKGYHPLRAQVAVDSALAQLGSPYVWNAAGVTTFDCSGLTLWAWGHAGIALTHYTGTQVQEGVRVAPNQLLPGDLLLFGADLHHVGMYLGAGYMIDAPTTGDYVKIQLVSDMGDYAVAVRP